MLKINVAVTKACHNDPFTFIQEAEKLGFEEVKLVTSDVQKSAIRLYEKIGFQKVRDISIDDGLAYFLPQFIHGMKRIEYVYKINKN